MVAGFKTLHDPPNGGPIHMPLDVTNTPFTSFHCLVQSRLDASIFADRKRRWDHFNMLVTKYGWVAVVDQRSRYEGWDYGGVAAAYNYFPMDHVLLSAVLVYSKSYANRCKA